MLNKNDIDIPLPDTAPDDLTEELAQSYTVVKKLLPFMVKRGIPASPKNYRLFYDYLLYSNPTLNKTINELLDHNAKFYSKLSMRLYDHFYNSEAFEMKAAAISKAAADFIDMSAELENGLSMAFTQTSHYQKILTDSSKQMTEVATPDELQPLLDELLSETETALAANDDLFSRISEANQIIASLKAELKNQTTLALVDELTKLYNRRHFHAEAPRLMNLAAKKALPLSAIMLDLDFFKRINDAWGHVHGDKVLVICAAAIRAAGEEDGMAVRMGGEEFLLMCPRLNLHQAALKAEEIRLAIQDADITAGGERLPVTVSAGVAQYVPGEDLKTFIDRADKALYQAKREGRNTVRMAVVANK
ncbi:MAG: GGDEF domain-containing protein [Candidatus Adiutrix sp.]|jgi:diguanylate cyclase|nr:GGDEF domain-containing protein [Candidatus Adiutrix sp.]